MAISIAVDILGCTGSVVERASTLNRIILVAKELKDSLGDLFGFTALMKALDLQQVTQTQLTHDQDVKKNTQVVSAGVVRFNVWSWCLLILQITRLEETWTALRRNFTQTAISYEKTLKPFYKNLYEAEGNRKKIKLQRN